MNKGVFATLPRSNGYFVPHKIKIDMVHDVLFQFQIRINTNYLDFRLVTVEKCPTVSSRHRTEFSTLR